MRRLWIDDERVPPQNWTGDPAPDWATTSVHAINLLRNAQEWDQPYDVVSFDHDLGGDDTTVRVIEWMSANDAWPTQELHVHSANPIGAGRIMRAALNDRPEGLKVYRTQYVA